MKRKYECNWNAEHNARKDFEHRWGIVCFIHRLAEDIWPCKLGQINADPKGKRHRLALKKTVQQIGMDQCVKVRLDRGKTRNMEILRGGVQTCCTCISLILFKWYWEYLTKENHEGFGDLKKGRREKGEVFSTKKQADGLQLRSKEEAVLQGTFDRLKLEISTNWK